MIDLPPGVTKRSIDTLISRGSPFSMGGTAIVCCLHGRQKRANADRFECDLVKDGRPHLCPCCESLYAKHSDEPGPCPQCQPGARTP
jgi:hypothetical protein